MVFPDKKYDVIYADPPWNYNDNGCNGAAQTHYSTMSLKDICQLPVQDISANDCVLFIWATYPMLESAFDVIKAWGFRYKTIGFQWIKTTRGLGKYFFGTGHWTSANTEPCLISIKGNPKPIKHNISQIIESPVTEHSQKPLEVKDKIKELMGKDKHYIESFARTQTQGWDSWGNEVTKFNSKNIFLNE